MLLDWEGIYYGYPCNTTGTMHVHDHTGDLQQKIYCTSDLVLWTAGSSVIKSMTSVRGCSAGRTSRRCQQEKVRPEPMGMEYQHLLGHPSLITHSDCAPACMPSTGAPCRMTAMPSRPIASTRITTLRSHQCTFADTHAAPQKHRQTLATSSVR